MRAKAGAGQYQSCFEEQSNQRITDMQKLVVQGVISTRSGRSHGKRMCRPVLQIISFRAFTAQYRLYHRHWGQITTVLTYQHQGGNTIDSIWNSEAMTEIHQQVKGGEATPLKC